MKEILKNKQNSISDLIAVFIISLPVIMFIILFGNIIAYEIEEYKTAHRTNKIASEIEVPYNKSCCKKF